LDSFASLKVRKHQQKSYRSHNLYPQ